MIFKYSKINFDYQKMNANPYIKNEFQIFEMTFKISENEFHTL